MNARERPALAGELERLRQELAERRASLPAHSVRPHQVLAVEELEARVAALERELTVPG